MIIAGMVVLTILAFLLINFFSGSGTDPGETAGPSKQALIEEIEELESSIVELEVVFQTLTIEEDMSKELLEIKREEIQKFDQKVQEQRRKIEDLEAKLAEARRRGDVDKETIDKLQSQIEEAKTNIKTLDDNFTKQEIEFLYMENRKLTATVDSLERMKPDSLLALLGDVRAQLNDCGTASPILTERGEEVDAEDLDKKIDLLNDQETSKAVIILKNFTKKKGTSTITGASYPAKDLEKLFVQYQIGNNEIEEFFVGTQMYLVVEDFDGKPISSKNGLKILKECGGKECIAAGQAVFQSGTGITFEFEKNRWKKDDVLLLKVFINGRQISKKILRLS